MERCTWTRIPRTAELMAIYSRRNMGKSFANKINKKKKRMVKNAIVVSSHADLTGLLLRSLVNV